MTRGPAEEHCSKTSKTSVLQGHQNWEIVALHLIKFSNYDCEIFDF